MGRGVGGGGISTPLLAPLSLADLVLVSSGIEIAGSGDVPAAFRHQILLQQDVVGQTKRDKTQKPEDAQDSLSTT